MSFLGPALLLGLLGLALPIAAHLLGREPPRRVPFAAVRFLRPVEPEITQRRRLHDRFLLLVRLLLLALLIVALARPVTLSSVEVAVVGEPHDAVIFVDVTGSMQLVVDGEREIDRAVERVEEIVRAMPVGTHVGLVTSDPRGPELPVAADLERAHAAMLEFAEAGTAAARNEVLADGLARATALLPPRRGDRPRAIYAVGDATASSLGSLPALAPGEVRIVRVPVRPASEEAPFVPEHVGIADLTVEPAPEIAPTAVHLRAVVARHASPEDASALEATALLRVDGLEVARAKVSVPPAGTAMLEFTHTLDPEAADRATAATVELVSRPDDPLPIDDARHVWLSSSESLDIVVVNGDPSETRVHDEVFFVATALSTTEAGSRMRIRALSPDQLDEQLGDDQDALGDVDLLVLANVSAPSPAVAGRVRARVAEGMGLWITVGDRVAPGEYNSAFGLILPLLLREATFAGTAPGRSQARDEGMSPSNLSHPIFAGFERDLDLSATRTRRMFLLEPDPNRDVDIALTFSGGAPALVTRTHELGRVAVLTTTVDRDWTDLPIRPGFVPLVERTVAWLCGARRSSASDRVLVGATKTLLAPTPLSVIDPSGRRIPIEGDEGVAEFEGTTVPGHYRASPSDAEGAEDAGQRFVVWVDPAESDTTMGVIARDESGEGASVDVHRPRWRLLTLLVLVLVAIESLVRSGLLARFAARPPSE